jgi:hypothetical protein
MPSQNNPLVTAASLLATAALIEAAADADVSVTVSGERISIQIPTWGDDEPTRAATVAAYAHTLGTPVSYRPGSRDSWVETDGVIGGRPVHVWTAIESIDRKEAHTTT